MPTTVTSASPAAPNKVLVQFSGPVIVNAAFYAPSNYAFSVRFGSQANIYATSVISTGASQALVTLTDAMLTNGHYALSVSNVIDATSAKVSSAQVVFDGIGLPQKALAIKKKVPSWWNTAYGTNLGTILEAVGNTIDTIFGNTATSAQTTVAQALSLRTATGADLTALAANYGVSRPTFALSNDAIFRSVIPILATQRKASLKIFYDALTAVLGPQSTAGWAIYETQPYVIRFEIPQALLVGLGMSTQGSSYFHPTAAVPSTDYPGSYLLADVSKPSSDANNAPVYVYQGFTIIDDIVANIKAAGVRADIVTI